RAAAPSPITPAGIEATLTWFELLEANLEAFVSGRMSAAEIIGQGGGRLWEAFQAKDAVCAVFGHGVARALAPLLAGKEVLVLGEGSHYSVQVPSPVSLVLALFDGWWDVPTSRERPQPGFLLPEHWFAAFETARFERISMESWTDGRRTFGGVYWAFAPA